MTESQLDGLRTIANGAEFEHIRIEAANILNKHKRFPSFDFRGQVLDLVLAYATTKLGQVHLQQRNNVQMVIPDAEDLANTIMEAGERARSV